MLNIIDLYLPELGEAEVASSFQEYITGQYRPGTKPVSGEIYINFPFISLKSHANYIARQYPAYKIE